MSVHPDQKHLGLGSLSCFLMVVALGRVFWVCLSLLGCLDGEMQRPRARPHDHQHTGNAPRRYSRAAVRLFFRKNNKIAQKGNRREGGRQNNIFLLFFLSFFFSFFFPISSPSVMARFASSNINPSPFLLVAAVAQCQSS